MSPKKYSNYLQEVTEYASEQAQLAYQRFVNKKAQDPKIQQEILARYESYAKKVVRSLCYSDDAVTQNIIRSLSGDDKIEIQQQKGVHAEMNILKKITGPMQLINYIGISKLCCGDCINKITDHNNTSQAKIAVKGSHFHDRNYNYSLYEAANKESAESSDQDNRPNQPLLSGCELKMYLLEQKLLMKKQEELKLMLKQSESDLQAEELKLQIQPLQKQIQRFQSDTSQNKGTWQAQLQNEQQSALQGMQQCSQGVLQSIESLQKLKTTKLQESDEKLLAQYAHILHHYIPTQLTPQVTTWLNNVQQGHTNLSYEMPLIPSPDTWDVTSEQQQLYKALQLLNKRISSLKRMVAQQEQLKNVENMLLEQPPKAKNMQEGKQQQPKTEETKQELSQQTQLQEKQSQNDQNLRRYGKGEGEDEMMEELVRANAGKEGVLGEMRKGASSEVKVEGGQDGEKKARKVELMGEMHDAHGGSVNALVEKMERGEMGAGTVVALERKEGGEHLGMRDVRLLAEVMRHNERCEESERIALPAGIEGSAIWWDAKLVNEAQKHGVQVVGVEGKGLAHGHGTQEYNRDREDYMAQQLAKLRQQGYDVVMPVGEAHVQDLQARLSANAAMETMRGMMQQNNVPLSPDKEPHISQHTATTKQVYGKFTAQFARSGLNNRSV